MIVEWSVIYLHLIRRSCFSISQQSHCDSLQPQSFQDKAMSLHMYRVLLAHSQKKRPLCYVCPSVKRTHNACGIGLQISYIENSIKEKVCEGHRELTNCILSMSIPYSWDTLLSKNDISLMESLLYFKTILSKTHIIVDFSFAVDIPPLWL